MKEDTSIHIMSINKVAEMVIPSAKLTVVQKDSWEGQIVTGVERSRQEAVTRLELLSLFKHHRSKQDETRTLLCSKYIFINKKAQGDNK